MRVAPALLALLALSLCAAPVRSDVHDLSEGVLILHGEPGIEWTNYCQMWPYHGIDSCSEQETRIDCDPGQDYLFLILHVLAAWAEPKEFCQVEFGLGDFDALNYTMWASFTDACFPGEGVETPTAGWPGPHEGVVLTATDTPWSSALAHVYVMAVYAYSYPGSPPPTAIPLAPHPTSGFGGTVNCLDPPEAFPAVCFGAVGIGMDGVYCCPEGPSPAEAASWGRLKNLYR